jgi:hypothetical protein
MYRSVFLVVLISSVLGFGISCKSDQPQKSTPSQPVPKKPTLPIPSDSFLINQVETNLRGLNMEDLNIAMKPLDLNSPYMTEAEHQMRGAFMVFEMEFRLHKVTIEQKSDSICIALVQHDAKNHNERTFSPIRSTQRYTWKPAQGMWKIHMMEVLGQDDVDF